LTHSYHLEVADYVAALCLLFWIDFQTINEKKNSIELKWKK